VAGVVDAAAGLPLVSPIGLASVFGDFARATTISTSIPLSLDFDGFAIKFDGKPAALLGAFDLPQDQANVQVPVDINIDDGTVEVEIEWEDSSGKGMSSAFEVAAAPASPGIFEFFGRAIVTNFSLGNDDVITGTWAHAAGSVPPEFDQFEIPIQAAAVGGVITIWCTGLGPVIQPDGQPPLETGNIPPAGALFTSKEVRVLIDNQEAIVLGAALQSSSVGLYQINAFVPDIPPNDSAEIIIEVICDDNTIVVSKSQTFISVRPAPATTPTV
jgi:uncharacterized protein (TIGR03437 family)